MTAAASSNSIDDGLGLVNMTSLSRSNLNDKTVVDSTNKLNTLNRKLASSNGNIYQNGGQTNGRMDKLDSSRLTSNSSIDFAFVESEPSNGSSSALPGSKTKTKSNAKDRELRDRDRDRDRRRTQDQVFYQTDKRLINRPKSSMNHNSNAHYNFRSSSVTTDSTTVNNNHFSSSKNASSTGNHSERPPGRLNYYDSDTNTLSEGLASVNNIRRSNSENLRKRRGKLECLKFSSIRIEAICFSFKL